MFHQLLTPVAGSLALSFCVAILPIATVLVLLGIFRRPAWQAALAGLIVGLILATTVWGLPAQVALASATNGAVFALWPVMWIVINALFVYNISVSSGRFDAFRAWVVKHLPNDRRVVLIVIAFCFGALLEGVAGFGTPVAITSSLLIMCGFPALEAIVFVLIFNTTPVAFGALGTPVTVLAQETGLPAPALAAMIGRQPAVLCHGAVRRVALYPLAVAGACGRRLEFWFGPVWRVELSRLYAHRCFCRADLAGGDAVVPAGVASRAFAGIRHCELIRREAESH